MTAITLQNLQVISVPRNLKLLNQNLFGFSIALKGTSKTISIDWNKFGFSEESLRSLKTSGVKISNVTLFKQLDEYALELNRQRKKVEERTLFVSEQRVVTESQINLALADYQELKELADELRARLHGDYLSGAAEFRERIASLLSTPEFQIPVDEQLLKVDEICQSFISPEEVNNLLRVELKIYKIPSLQEQIQGQTKLKNDLTALRKAERQQQAEAALAIAQKEDLIRSKELREGIFAKAKLEIENIVAQQIEAITKYEPDAPNTNSQQKIDAHFKRNNKIRAKLASHLKRMQVLTEIGFEGSVKNAVSQLEDLSQAMNSNISSINLQQSLKQLQQELQTSLNQIEQIQTPVLESAPILL